METATQNETEQPKEISVLTTGTQLASFDYYEGQRLATERNLKQTTKMSEVYGGGHYIVTCGDVVFRVEPNEYTNVKRTQL